MAQFCVVDVCRRANEEVRGEFSVEEDIVEKQKQWISVALRTDSDTLPANSKQNGQWRSFQCWTLLVTLSA